MSPQDPYEGDDAAWAAFGGAGPRWRDDDLGPPPQDPRRRRQGDPRRPSRQGEPLVFDDYQDPGPGASIFSDPADGDIQGSYEADYRDSTGYEQQPGHPPVYDTDYDDAYVEEAYVQEQAPPPPPTTAKPRASAAGRPVAPRQAGQPAGGSDRDMRTAVLVGLGLVVAALILFQIDPVGVLLLAAVILGAASLEYFTETRRAGFDPLMPVGVTATVGMAISAYYYGERALPLAMALTVVVCLAWYLVGAGGERPVANVGATLLGVCWVGFFGAYAGLLLSAPNGEALLAAAIVPTIGYDVGALFVGRSAGSRSLSSASPNKTLEGLAGGMVLAVVGGVLLGIGGLHPFNFTEGLLVGIVAACAAPLGDLCQSLVKRDLGVKDMGNVLPGHGGVLDRFDGLLFVLPAIWYLAVVKDGFI